MYWNIRIKGSDNQFSQKCNFVEVFFIQEKMKEKEGSSKLLSKRLPTPKKDIVSLDIYVLWAGGMKKRWARQRRKEFNKGLEFMSLAVLLLIHFDQLNCSIACLLDWFVLLSNTFYLAWEFYCVSIGAEEFKTRMINC